MNKSSVGTGKILVFTLATIMLVRGIVILFAGDDASEWNKLLGVGGLTDVDAQLGVFGSVVRVAQLIEGRLWIIVAFPLFLRLSWGREVAVLVAGLGMVIQCFRLLAEGGLFAVIWLVIYAGIALLFYAQSSIKAHFATSQDVGTQPN